VAKKNTRKKKAKDANIYAGGAGGELDVAGAFDEGADSDEVHARKGGKNNNKKEKHQGKKKGKKQESDEEDEETKEEAKEEEAHHEVAEQSVEEESGGLPLDMIYCRSKYQAFN